MAFCPVTNDLNKHIAKIEEGDAFEVAVEELAEKLDNAAVKAMRQVMVESVYETSAADMFSAMPDDEFFYNIAEALIKAHKRG